MNGSKSYTELLASVAGPGFASLSANQWGSQSAALEIPPVDAFSYGDWHLHQSYSSAASSGSESSSSGGEEEDDAVRVPDPSHLDADETESADVDHYGAASDTFASEMHNAAAPVLPETFVPPKSLYIKRKRTGKGQELPTCRPPSEVGAVEAALRASASKKTAQIFYPTPGTVFDSLAEAYEFYNLYSWEVGFGVRYGRSNINKGNNYKTKQEIECGNAGSDKRCSSQSQRCECKAVLKLLRTEDHGWYVSQIIEDHNHPLSECCGEKMQWKSHRTIDIYTKDMIRYLRENNVSLSKVHCILGSVFGGVKDLPFTKRSLRTICAQIARDQMDDDVKKTLEVFRKMRDEDPEFSFSVDLDGLNRVKTLIWTNSRSKMQYTCFGDVVTFDTTFCTNIYRMPFGLFVGVNNHFQTTIYAGVLMRDETEKSFEWVYKEFLSLMGGKHPQTLLTDQCVAMMNACGTVMPNTTHLWCKWHVLRKAQESLGPVYSKKSEFRHQFHKVLNEMLTIDEFEGAWEAILVKYNLRDNPFMTRIYECRRKWAKPFFFDKFCARMLSTQRVESANHMLKTYVPRNSSMNRFVLQYNNLLFDRGVEEDREEHKTKQVHNLSKRMWPIQRHAAKIYTRNAYKLFTDEVDKVTYYRVFEIEEDSLYEVHHINAERRESWSRVVFKINVEKSHLRFDCECGLYTHFGILCCHALAVIVNLGISEIPKAHILKRWTRNARDVLPPHLVMYQKDTPAMHSKTFRHSLLYTHAMESVKMGDTNLDTFKVMMKYFAAGQKEVKAMIDAIGSLPVDDPMPNYDSSDAEWRRDRGVGYQSEPDIAMSGHMQYGVSGSSAGMTTAELSSIKAPLVARKAGRPRLNRFLSPLEPKRKRKHSSSKPGYVRQTRFCSKCRCSGHKITNCPENPDAGKKKRKQARCSICGMTGHKSNQCLTKTPIIEDYEESSEDVQPNNILNIAVHARLGSRASKNHSKDKNLSC